jgi:hypothetical protein
MTDRCYVVKAADAGAGKLSLLQEDPLPHCAALASQAIMTNAPMAVAMAIFKYWFLFMLISYHITGSEWRSYSRLGAERGLPGYTP